MDLVLILSIVLITGGSDLIFPGDQILVAEDIIMRKPVSTGKPHFIMVSLLLTLLPAPARARSTSDC